MITLPSASTALILIDLQNGITAFQTEPHSSHSVVTRCQELAHRFRNAGAPVVVVNVGFSSDFADALNAPIDQPLEAPPGGFVEGWDDIVDGLAAPSDIRITKRHWGAFYGTELDLQLRRRGVSTVVIAGIATNLGVESTARSAHEHGYAVVLVEDATASFSTEMHAFAFEHIFPRLGRSTTSVEIELQS